MKKLFLESKSDVKLKRLRNIEILPNKIALVSTVQFSEQLKELKATLENSGKQVFIGKSGKTKHEGQILGCDVAAAQSVNDDVDAVLYLGEGLFHPRLLLLKLKKPIYFLNPARNRIYRLRDAEIRRIKIAKKVALMKYLSSKEIGILVTTKPGQNKMKAAEQLKKKLIKEGKNAYILLFDTLDYNQLENFPFIEMFVNTACPRMAIDDKDSIRKPVLNIEDIPQE